MSEADFSPDLLRAAVAQAGELYAEFHAGLAGRPVDPGCSREAIIERIGGRLGESGIGMAAAIEEFGEQILPCTMSTPHPLYAGLVNSSPLPIAPVADLLVSMLNNNAGAFHQSPPGTIAEEEVARAFADLLGLGGEFSGMLLPGGTFANLQGLLMAVDARFPERREKGGAALGEGDLLYASSATHFSVERSVQVLGIGSRQVVSLPTVGRGELDVAALQRRVTEDRRAGRQAFALVATLGSTSTGAIDDLASIAAICREEKIWLHVDACYGGGLALCEELRPCLQGLELADSVAIDPHKWFFMPITAALLLCRHPQVEKECFRVDAPYIPESPEPEAYLRGIPTSRRSLGLSLWLCLRAHGWETIRAAVKRNISQIRRLETGLAERGFRVLPEGRLSIACVRWEPPGHSARELDELQKQISFAAIASGKAWFSTTMHEGQVWLRFNVVNLHTRDAHVDKLVALVDGLASRLAEDY